jgi:hypothetical protein
VSFRSLFGQLAFALKARKAMAAVTKAEEEGFSVQLMLWKGLKTFGLALSMQLVPVALAALSNEALIRSSLEGADLPAAVVVTVTALLVAGGKMAANWWNHRDGPK